MRFHVVTLFPEVIDAYTGASIIGRAQKNKVIKVQSVQLRDFAGNKWGKVDERPFGGGPGMVLRAEPVVKAVEKIKKGIKNQELRIKKKAKTKVLITAAGGVQFTNAYAQKLVKNYTDVVIVCGRYEGIDERARKILKAENISVGPYVLTGGEVPALAIIDATARHIEGVLGKFESVEEKRVSSHEIYTRPEVLEHAGRKYRAPKVLLSGHHAKMEEWKKGTK